MDDLAVFGANVRKMRNARGWRQKDLADRCGVNLATIGAIEGALNSTGLLNAIKLARIFGVGLDQLTGNAAYTRQPARQGAPR